jgi:hypothetical protein
MLWSTLSPIFAPSLLAEKRHMKVDASNPRAGMSVPIPKFAVGLGANVCDLWVPGTREGRPR